jgi:hypothetical protein
MMINQLGIVAFALALAFSSCKTKSKAVDAKVTSGAELSEKEQLDFAYLFFDAEKETILGNDH